ncbi:Endoplasmic reticulum transmembrane protein 3 [Hamiltosporidium tvaerminnensis]|nr:Endoplasmic reticulum transmembrane protein 3 [Hamiltosporidium tvaerminnensis]
MGITTNIVLVVLFTEISLFTILLSPFTSLKKSFVNVTNSLTFAIRHILMAIYSMIFLLFIDSLIKILKTKNEMPYTNYNSEISHTYYSKNVYLSSFTLFLAIVYKRFTILLLNLYKEEEKAEVLKKQAINQKSYVSELVSKNEEKEEIIKKLYNEIESKSKEVKCSEVLVKQAKNNQDEYLKLLEKYNKLVDLVDNKKNR